MPARIAALRPDPKDRPAAAARQASARPIRGSGRGVAQAGRRMARTRAARAARAMKAQ